ncbi:MAG: hypothetical protein ACJ789_10800 [Thermomicrobiales bacterium]
MSGQPADDETVNAITAVVRGSIACSNAGDILRSLAYFTDAYVARMFSGENGVDYEGFLQFVATPPAPVRKGQRLALIAIKDVQQLEDGRVAATVVTGDPSNPFVDEIVFAKSDGQWLIDGSTPLTTLSTTPTA